VRALSDEAADLPNSLPAEPETAKRFDMLLLRTQLAVLRSEPTFTVLRDRIRSIAEVLETYPTIPGIKAQMDLIEEIQTEDWWADVTLPMLEDLRLRMRLLVGNVGKAEHKRVFTNFADELSDAVEVELSGVSSHPGSGSSEPRPPPTSAPTPTNSSSRRSIGAIPLPPLTSPNWKRSS